MSDDKIAQIRARHKRDNSYGDGFYPGAHRDRALLLDENEKLRAEIERLREALSWYANENNYKTTSVHMCGHSTGQSVLMDRGNRARKALEGKP